MRAGSENDRQRLAAWTSVLARAGCEAVSLPALTEGAVILGQIFPPDPRKSKDFLRIGRKNRIPKIPRVKHRSFYEYTPRTPLAG